MRKIVIAVIVLVSAAGGAYWRFGRGGDEDVAAFFTLPTPTVCETGALAITSANSHFAAFTEGRVPAETGGRFLLADVSVANAGSAPVPVSEDSFYLTERPGEKRTPVVVKGDARPLSVELQPGEKVSGTIAFSAPSSVGAAKLVFDDGCTHQEWLVP